MVVLGKEELEDWCDGNSGVQPSSGAKIGGFHSQYNRSCEWRNGAGLKLYECMF